MEAMTIDMASYIEVWNILGLTKNGVNSPENEAFHYGA
jgi:hypothetical protein